MISARLCMFLWFTLACLWEQLRHAFAWWWHSWLLAGAHSRQIRKEQCPGGCLEGRRLAQEPLAKFSSHHTSACTKGQGSALNVHGKSKDPGPTVPGALLLRSLHMLNALQHRGARYSLRAIICGGRALVLGRVLHDYLCGFGPDLCWSCFEGCLHHMWDYSTCGWNHCSLKWNMAHIRATSDTAGISFSFVLKPVKNSYAIPRVASDMLRLIRYRMAHKMYMSM